MRVFKVGDRVKCVHDTSNENILIGYKGTVKSVYWNIGVEWDKNVGGHNGNGCGMVGRNGHCWYVSPHDLQLVEDIQLEFNFEV